MVPLAGFVRITAAIVIRGTQMRNIDSLHEDADIGLVPVPWIDPRLPILAMVGKRFVTACRRLLKARDPATGRMLSTSSPPSVPQPSSTSSAIVLAARWHR